MHYSFIILLGLKSKQDIILKATQGIGFCIFVVDFK